MRLRWILPILLLASTLALTACATAASPPSRLASYLPDAAVPAVAPMPQASMRAGLLLIPDTGAPQAAPPAPEEALNRLAAQLQERITGGLPMIRIDTIIPFEGSGTPTAETIQELGRRHGVEYVLLAIVSSTEQEYPMTLFLGWTTHAQPGWRRDNWSLIEVALVDVGSGRTVLHAEGRGWATLDWPSAPGINQWYPVIYLRPNDPVRRIWPPTYEGAPNTLRVVALNEAAKRLVLNLQDAYYEKRQADRAASAN